jgi:hypothetical protein
MVNQSASTAYTNIHLTWQAILWRLILTALLLLLLAGSRTAFVTTTPETHVLPALNVAR